MKPYPKGTRMGKFPVQETDDPAGPFSGQGVYFQQRRRQDVDVYYLIERKKPVKEIIYRGAATFNMKMQLLDARGNLVMANAGPFKKGNNYSEHSIKVPAHTGRRFILRFTNQASVWFYIEKLTLK